MNILIVKMSAIGDVIHTLPALNAIRRHYPHARITWLVEEAALDIVEGHAALDRVILSKRKKWIKELFSWKYRQSLKKLRNFLKELRDTEYDIIIDFHGLFKSGVMVMLARGKRKIGFDRGMDHAEYSHLFYNERIKPISMEVHALRRGLILLEVIGIKADRVEYNLPVLESDRLEIIRLFDEKKVDSKKKIICINPQATWETKLWSKKKFAALSDKIINDFHAQVIFTGGDSDRGDVSEIISMMQKPCFNFTGLTTLKTLAALYEKADILVTTDTGPMHLGVAAGTKVVSIFGATAPWRTGPYGDLHEIVRSEISCSPCFKRECKTKECMESISVDHVLKAVEKLWNRQETG